MLKDLLNRYNQLNSHEIISEKSYDTDDHESNNENSKSLTVNGDKKNKPSHNYSNPVPIQQQQQKPQQQQVVKNISSSFASSGRLQNFKIKFLDFN